MSKNGFLSCIDRFELDFDFDENVFDDFDDFDRLLIHEERTVNAPPMIENG
jgi:hypothetical protein